MFSTELVGFTRWVKWITQADDAVDLFIFGNHAGDAPTHRFSTD